MAQDDKTGKDDKSGSNDKGKGKGKGPGPLVAFFGGVVATLAVLLVLGLVTVYSGGYNVAASEEHTSMVRWALDTNFHRSVERSAAGIAAPQDLSDARIATGGAEYKESCAVCHGGPGGDRPDWVAAMRPTPPLLAEAAAEWEINEVFWLAKHGVRMTGMPAFGASHDDETLWGIAAFVKQLPAMTPEAYAALGADRGEAPAPAEEAPSGTP